MIIEVTNAREVMRERLGPLGDRLIGKILDAEAEFYTHKDFIPQISFQIPNAERENPNLNFKIDDIDFDETNNGVWCFDLKDICNNDDYITHWDQYKDDKIL